MRQQKVYTREHRMEKEKKKVREYTREEFNKSAPFNYSLAEKGDPVIRFISERGCGVTVERLDVVRDAIRNFPIGAIVYSDGIPTLLKFTDTAYELRMAPKEKERHTVFLNVYPDLSGKPGLAVYGCSSREFAETEASSRRQGKAVELKLVKNEDGNWEVDKD